MTSGLPPYAAYRDSGVPWLGPMPAHWSVERLRNVAKMPVSNVDKLTKDDEIPVRLCNYVNVYKNERITDRLHFMQATATPTEQARFRLRQGDVIITKDSEIWNDTGVSALVEYSAPDLLCGYHLALLRPYPSCFLGGYMLRALQTPGVAYQFYVAANGVTRFGLSHDAIKTARLPLPPSPNNAPSSATWTTSTGASAATSAPSSG